jgi:hypothetical protein
MPPEHARTFGGGVADTALQPVVLAALILALVLIIALPRRYVLWPFLLITFLVPLGQGIVIAGAHFYVGRIVVIAGLLRLASAALNSKGRVLAAGYNSIDSAFFWCTACQTVAVLLLFRDMPSWINQFGVLLDTLGTYVLLRFFIRDEEDTFRVLKCLALISLVLAVCMVVEQVKLINVFSFIGGNRATPELREGKIRSQAVFQHTLLAGAFGATLLPLFMLLWRSAASKFIGLVGIVGSTVMTITSNSSTPLLAYVAGLLGVCLWRIRRKMRMARWTLIAALAALAVVMKAPVWFVIAHIDLTGGSSGYHRAEVIDQCIRHFTDWWLIGVKDTGSWGWDLWDAQNQFVNVAETGGLAALILFIVMISRCFGRIGKARKLVEGDRRREWCLWLLGAALFSHTVGFFGVNYFDQTRVSWLALLAMISAVTGPILQSPSDTQPLSAAAEEPVVSEAMTPLAAMPWPGGEQAVSLRGHLSDRCYE